ncbi:F-box-like protein [Rhizoctonia solani 123E]|uniref:F-box-like protein n=1 Tax=Rhizoctonia solani 123E TaxID=1423351 RepID=A0A074SII1_9AGAM|nr:F-box-like protein [Rhizoctonia solani 123E]
MSAVSRGTIESIPTEILTECLAYLEPRDLSNVLSVSRALRTVASDDTLWQLHCEHIYNKGSSEVLGWRPIDKYNGLAYHLIWKRLALVEPYLGWWLSIDELPAGSVLRMWLNGQTLVVSGVIPVTTLPSSSIPQTLAISDAMDYIIAHNLHDGFPNPLYIDAQNICLEQWSAKESEWLRESPSKIMHQVHRLQTFHASNKLDVGTRTDSAPFKWTFRNSPGLFSAIKHSGVVHDDKGYAMATSVPTLSFPRGLSPRPFVAIHSPFEESDHSPLIANGTWVASYGEAHGCEFIHLHVRKVNEHDLNGQWGDEGSLASAVTPFGQDVQDLFSLPAPPALRLSFGDVQVGNTIVEAIKLTGDVNVPRGVRTFVGFLDHRDAWSGPSENGDFVPRDPSHPWPLVPGSALQSGVPATALPAKLEEMRTQDVPARGMTMPGLMRVSETGFLDPKWANATIHIASRKEIRVMLLDGHHVTTFYKIEKSMFEPMN